MSLTLDLCLLSRLGLQQNSDLMSLHAALTLDRQANALDRRNAATGLCVLLAQSIVDRPRADAFERKRFDQRAVTLNAAALLLRRALRGSLCFDRATQLVERRKRLHRSKTNRIPLAQSWRSGVLGYEPRSHGGRDLGRQPGHSAVRPHRLRPPRGSARRR
jgi:hypothetical protein